MVRSLPARVTGVVAAIPLVVVVVGCAVAPPVQQAGPPRTDVVDLKAIHDATSPKFDRACLDCHADIMKRGTLDPRRKEAHAAMIPFMPDYDAKVGVTNDNCRSCHVNVDAIQHSGALVRKNTDMAVCETCHGKGGPSRKAFYAN